MIFHQIRAGGDRNFAYLVGDGEGGEAALFDPPPDPEAYLSLVKRHRLRVRYVVATHGHSDHTWGLTSAARTTGGAIVAHRNAPVRADRPVDDGDRLPLGEGLTLEILHTPGHTEDAICIRVGGYLITGDTLFVGKVGGTDYGEGARKEWDSLHRLMELPEDTVVCPGHDYGVKPLSTIGEEKRTNPFLLRPTFEAFLDLKKNWLEYKRKHGIP
jgi:glyoxylase-like metal-dependent hydrolase (beta-lactamase superfamily II)